MALDPNIGRIKFLRSKTVGRKPTTADIAEGELALNLADRTIYTRNGNNIVDIGFGLGGNVKGNIGATGNISATGGICVSNQYIDESLTPANGIYSKGPITSSGQVTAPGFSGPLNGNASSASVLQISRAINGVGFNGGKDITIPGFYDVVAGDHRQLRPNMTRSAALGVYFTSINGLNSTAGTDYADLLAFNTFIDASGGLLNGLAFPKSGKSNPIHYRSTFGANEWGAGRTLAYLDDDSTGNSATATRLKSSMRLATAGAVAWYRLGKVTIPQYGRSCVVRLYGGTGYNGGSGQSTVATIVLKTGNANPNNAGIAMDVVDNTSTLRQVGLFKLDDTNYEIFAQFGEYSTFNAIVEEEEGTAWTWQWASYNSLPNGFVTGQVRVLAQTTSNVASATKLQTPRTINGVAFDGTSDILIQDNHSILMPRGANFDDYQGPGSYYCPANVDADTMPNRPMGGAFSLEVKRTAGVIQKYTHYETARCFVRKFYNTWGPWREIAMLNLANTFTENQVIVSSSIAQLRVSGTNESVVTYNNSARWIDTKVSGGTFGIFEAGKWLFYTNGLDEFNVNTNFEVNANKTFVIRGGESSRIQNHINKGGDIKVNAPEATSAIMGALGFNWYSNNYQIGVIRGGSTNSHGFGLTKGNSELLWRVDPQGAMYTGPILGREYIDVQGNSTATQMISRSGRFGAHNSAYHYIDVGQYGRDMTTIAQYNGAFQFINSSTGTSTFYHSGGVNPVVSNRRMIVSSDTWSATVAGLGDGYNSAINTTEQFIPAGQTGYNALLAGKVQSTGVGYRTNVSIGVYRGSNTWSNSGAYIAVGGSDVSPTESFHFNNGGYFGHSSGHIEIYSDLWLQNGNIRTNSAELQILTTGGGAKRIATGGVLASDTYADMVNVPNLGIYSKGDIRTPLWMYAAKFAGNVDAPNRVDISGAPGGGTNNGLRAGPMDAALYAGCNLDIQTHNGLGIVDNTGARRIVFEARTGTIHCEGSVNAGTINSNGNILAQANITANGSIFAAGNVTAFSDRRLKENIKPIDNVIDRIKKLNGVTYTRNDLEDKERTHTGLIAQDVQQAMPESVVETEDGILTVDYQSLVGLLTETIKNLNARIEKLENK